MSSNPKLQQVKEIWKDVIGYEGIYTIDISGTITSNKINRKKGFVFKGGKNASGYITVGLRKDGIHKTCLMHRLLAQHFIPNPESKPYINHINGIRHDNRLENLEWCTQKENVHHYINMGLKKVLSLQGHLHPNSRLSFEQILEIRKKYSDGIKTGKLMAEYGEDNKTIWNIVNYRTYKNVP